MLGRFPLCSRPICGAGLLSNAPRDAFLSRGSIHVQRTSSTVEVTVTPASVEASADLVNLITVDRVSASVEVEILVTDSVETAQEPS